MEASGTKFEEFLTPLAGDADLELSPQWLRTGQQQSTCGSALDGYIAQDSFKIAVETKRTPHSVQWGNWSALLDDFEGFTLVLV
ncbi:MAG TPA: hypothetical protein VHX63_16490 [Acidobacteriaceae bacterium]|jgi:hypothetical protein|nr:hypothetical protein [Acidobacteriaceae bacterium]